MFARATIRLGIGPHSSFVYFVRTFSSSVIMVMQWRTPDVIPFFLGGGVKFSSDFTFTRLGICHTCCPDPLTYSTWQFWGYNKSLYISLGALLIAVDRRSICTRISRCMLLQTNRVTFFCHGERVLNKGGRSVRQTCVVRTKLIALATVDVLWRKEQKNRLRISIEILAVT